MRNGIGTMRTIRCHLPKPVRVLNDFERRTITRGNYVFPARTVPCVNRGPLLPARKVSTGTTYYLLPTRINSAGALLAIRLLSAVIPQYIRTPSVSIRTVL